VAIVQWKLEGNGRRKTTRAIAGEDAGGKKIRRRTLEMDMCMRMFEDK